MDDNNISKALSAFTKVNGTIVKRLDRIERTQAKQSNKQEKQVAPEEVVKESEPIEIEGFSNKAGKQLGKILSINADFMKKQQEASIKKSPFLSNIGSFAKGIMGDLLGSLAKGFGYSLLAGLAIDIAKKLFNTPAGQDIAVDKSRTKVAAKALNKSLEVATKVVNGLSRYATTAEKVVAEAASKAAASTAKSVSGVVTKMTPPKKTGEMLRLEKLIETKTRMANQARGLAALGGPSAPYLNQKALYKEARVQEGAARSYGKQLKTLEESASKAATTATVKSEVQAGEKVLAKPGFFGQIKNFASKAVKGVGKFGTETLAKASGPLRMITKILESGPMKFLTRVLRVPGITDAIFGAVEINKAISSYEKGDISKAALHKMLAAAGAGTLGSFGGGALLGTIGAGLGLAGGPVSILTGIAGTAVGTYAGDKFSRMIMRHLPEGLQDEFGEMIAGSMVNTPLLFNKFKEKYAQDDTPGKKIDDGIVSKGKTTAINPNDTVYAMKTDGPLDRYFSNNLKVAKENMGVLEQYSNNSTTLLTRQLEVLVTNNKLLREVADRMSARPSNSVNINGQSIDSAGITTLRDVQGAWA